MSTPTPPGTEVDFQSVNAGGMPVVRPAAPLTFAQKKWVQEVLPWVTSGVLHLGLILSAVLVYKTAEKVIAVVREQIIIPEAAIIDNAPPGGVVNPGLGADPNRPAAQDQITDSSRTQVRMPGQRLNEAVSSGADGGNDSMLSIGANQAFPRGRGDGTGAGDGGTASGVFGVPGGGGGGGPRVNFVGSSGNARRIVFLCDASGSMLSVFPAMQRQLRQSIDQLRPIQSFSVVIFSDNVRSLSQNLIIANPDNKRRAFDFVATQSAAGGTRPSAAIQQAFAMNPELIFVLTDGFDQGDPREILEQFRRLNRDKRVKVNTIRIRAAEDPELVRLLRTIAEESGGTYREVDKDDF